MNSILFLIGILICVFIFVVGSLYIMTSKSIFKYVAGIFWVICLIWYIVYQIYLIVDSIMSVGGV